MLESADRRWLNNVGQLRCKDQVASKLPLLISQQNRKIEREFSQLKDELIRYSQQYSTRVADLKSQPILLDDGSYFTLVMHVSVMNIRPSYEDLFGPSDEYVADVVVNGKQEKPLLIKIIFMCGGTAPKLRKPHVIFNFERDRLTDTFSLEPTLKGVKSWQARVEDLAHAQVYKINQSNISEG